VGPEALAPNLNAGGEGMGAAPDKSMVERMLGVENSVAPAVLAPWSGATFEARRQSPALVRAKVKKCVSSLSCRRFHVFQKSLDFRDMSRNSVEQFEQRTDRRLIAAAIG
jgi:hypothetical protein